MKNLILVISIISAQAFAVDMGTVKDVGAKAMEKGKAVADACKKEQVEFCKNLKEVEALKECLKKNKEKLSAGCKSSLGI